MLISVIVPTIKRVESLLNALESLQYQTKQSFEIIVVDNDADPRVCLKINEFNLTSKVPVQYISEPRLGLHNARHTGVRYARGELLVFTDDDASFHPSWIQAYAEEFENHPEMVAAGGPVRPVWQVPPPTWVVEFMDGSRVFGILSIVEGPDEFQLSTQGFFFGVNMAIRRTTLFEVNGFNPDSFGDIWLGDGETGLNRKLWQKGYKIGYVPDAVVFHHIPQTRMTAEYFCRRMANEGASAEYSAFHLSVIRSYRLVWRLGLIIWDVVRLALSTCKRSIANRDQFLLLRARMGLAYHLSRLRFVCRLMCDQQFQQFVLRKDWL